MHALVDAVAKVVEDHRRRARPLAVWRDGKAVWISPSKPARSARRRYLIGPNLMAQNLESIPHKLSTLNFQLSTILTGADQLRNAVNQLQTLLHVV